MITKPFARTKDLRFERSYTAPLAAVWDAWTQPDQLRQWWGPDKTTVVECEVDLRVGGSIRITTEATEAMGKYQGTRWPMEATITLLEPMERLTYEARAWTEGEEAGTTIRHVTDLTLAEHGGTTTVTLHIAVSEIGPKAKMAVFGMKWGYKQQFAHLAELLEG